MTGVELSGVLDCAEDAAADNWFDELTGVFESTEEAEGVGGIIVDGSPPVEPTPGTEGNVPPRLGVNDEEGWTKLLGIPAVDPMLGIGGGGTTALESGIGG